jgi:hypothetical protein
MGNSDIYVAERDEAGRWSVRNLGPPVSTAADEYEAAVSEDGNTLVLVADRGDRSHLYRFVKRDDRWHELGLVPADPHVFQVGPRCHRMHNGCCSLRPPHRSRAKCF